MWRQLQLEAHRAQLSDESFRVAARRLSLRECPSCHAAIQRYAGCNSMQCRCGAHFNWQHALPAGEPLVVRLLYRAGHALARIFSSPPLVFAATAWLAFKLGAMLLMAVFKFMMALVTASATGFLLMVAYVIAC